ncbi:translocation/assembly module TamB domain-containing protein [Mesohalobacter salilacus]|uniref:translocation/assembly module TamB domain-containing protein n=1 Tax=Mesohalobacter salilacus TaxID=2491711 RepID=UPI00403E9AAA
MLVLFIRSPWCQDIIVGKVTTYVSEKIDTKFEIGKLYVTFSGNITLEELYIEDKSKDTLLYSQYLEANVPFRPLIFDDEIQVDMVDWRGLKANVSRKDSLKGFNFQYIVDAFTSPEEERKSPETAQQSPIKISLGRILFSDFDLSFIDEVTGINTQLKLGHFALESKAIDLQNMKFHLSDINLQNTSIDFTQSKAPDSSETEESSALPWILIDNLNIGDVNVNYTAPLEGIISKTYIDSFTFTGLDANLNRQDVEMKTLVWKDSRIKLDWQPTEKTKNTANASTSNPSFSWPNWSVSIEDIDFQNQKIEFFQNGEQPKKGEFSAEAIAINQLNLNLKHLELSKDESLRFMLNKFQFKEKSGLVLNEFQVDTRLNATELQLNNLRFGVNNSQLNADLELNYSNIDELVNSPEKSNLSLNVRKLLVDVRDAYVFSPELESNPQIQNLSQHNFEGNFNAEGNIEFVKINKFQMRWGKDTNLQFDGQLSKITKVNDFGFELNNLVAKTQKKDLLNFISEADIGVSLPKVLALNGDFRKTNDDFFTDSKLESSFGNIQINGFLNATKNIDFKLDIDILDVQLNELLNNEALGVLSMQINSQGKGNSIYNLNADLSSTIDSLRLNDYTFSGMKIQGNLDDGSGELNFDYNDNNLKFDVASQIKLDSISSKIDTRIDLEGIKTKAFGLSSKDFRAKVVADILFEGDVDDFQFSTQLKDGLVVYDNQPYYLGDVNLSADVDAKQTRADIESQFLNGYFNANSNIKGVLTALEHHFKNYTEDSISNKKSDQFVNFDLKLNFNQTPLLSEVFVDGINQMDTLRASFSFEENKNLLKSSIDLPHLNYQDNEIEGLNFNLESNGSEANFVFGFNELLAEPIKIPQTEFVGVFENRQLSMNIDAFKDGKDFFSSSFSLKFEDDELYRLHILPDKLILNDKPWTISDDNEIVFQNNAVDVSNFKLSRNTQQFQLKDDLEFDKPHVAMVFDNFNLSTITNYFNHEEKLAEGKISGNLVLIEPFTSNGLVSDFNIENLKVTKVPLGNLSLMAVAKPDDNYQLNLNLKDAGVDLGINGIYHTTQNSSDLDLNIDLQQLDMQTIEGFASEFINNAEGQLNGEFSIDGPLENLDYKGFLSFSDVKFNLKALNTVFQLKNEIIELAKNNLKFSQFEIADSQGNIFSTNGLVDMTTLTNPKFDLSFEAQDFQLLNSTAEDNEVYFGKLVFDASAKLKGNLDLPKIDLSLNVKDETDLTYIIQESQASIEERDGIVLFVNKSNPDDILTQKSDEDYKAVITGVDFKSDISIQDKSKVKVIINKRTGDNASIQGGGDLKFGISPTGKMNLTGKYEVTDGSIELNLYNLAKRKFNIAAGSSITWQGNPYDADLDLRAIYNIETSVSSLMASQTAGENAVIQNRYKQQLPFFVYLDVDGDLLSPEISFKLDMPEDKKGAINGSVYGRISQLNQNEDQVNKQVFSLLVLNRFYPESGSDGSQGGAASMARENVNQVLSDQLNAFSDRLTGNTGISLNFDINSYTQYQGNTAQDRTDLDVTAQKELMDGRLVVEAGSQMNVQGEQRPGESQAAVGNVSVEYLLTEDGRWKLRAFRTSEYENIIDGQVVVSGIALIFAREFNKFKTLWNKAYRESLKEKEVEPDSEDESDTQEKADDTANKSETDG